MKIGNYIIANEEKWNRAIYGMVTRLGALDGGVGEDATDAQKLAAYDKLGGLVQKAAQRKSKKTGLMEDVAYTIKIGSFYDFKKKAMKEKPQVVLVFRDIDGDVVEIAEDEPIPMEVEAALVAEEKKQRGRPRKDAEEKDADE